MKEKEYKCKFCKSKKMLYLAQWSVDGDVNAGFFAYCEKCGKLSLYKKKEKKK